MFGFKLPSDNCENKSSLSSVIQSNHMKGLDNLVAFQMIRPHSNPNQLNFIDYLQRQVNCRQQQALAISSCDSPLDSSTSSSCDTFRSRSYDKSLVSSLSGQSELMISCEEYNLSNIAQDILSNRRQDVSLIHIKSAVNENVSICSVPLSYEQQISIKHQIPNDFSSSIEIERTETPISKEEDFYERLKHETSLLNSTYQHTIQTPDASPCENNPLPCPYNFIPDADFSATTHSLNKSQNQEIPQYNRNVSMKGDLDLTVEIDECRSAYVNLNRSKGELIITSAYHENCDDQSYQNNKEITGLSLTSIQHDSGEKSAHQSETVLQDDSGDSDSLLLLACRDQNETLEDDFDGQNMAIQKVQPNNVREFPGSQYGQNDSQPESEDIQTVSQLADMPKSKDIQTVSRLADMPNSESTQTVSPSVDMSYSEDIQSVSLLANMPESEDLDAFLANLVIPDQFSTGDETKTNVMPSEYVKKLSPANQGKQRNNVETCNMHQSLEQSYLDKSRQHRSTKHLCESSPPQEPDADMSDGDSYMLLAANILEFSNDLTRHGDTSLTQSAEMPESEDLEAFLANIHISDKYPKNSEKFDIQTTSDKKMQLQVHFSDEQTDTQFGLTEKEHDDDETSVTNSELNDSVFARTNDDCEYNDSINLRKTQNFCQVENMKRDNSTDRCPREPVGRESGDYVLIANKENVSVTEAFQETSKSNDVDDLSTFDQVDTCKPETKSETEVHCVYPRLRHSFTESATENIHESNSVIGKTSTAFNEQSDSCSFRKTNYNEITSFCASQDLFDESSYLEELNNDHKSTISPLSKTQSRIQNTRSNHDMLDQDKSQTRNNDSLSGRIIINSCLKKKRSEKNKNVHFSANQLIWKKIESRPHDKHVTPHLLSHDSIVTFSKSFHSIDSQADLFSQADYSVLDGSRSSNASFIQSTPIRHTALQPFRLGKMMPQTGLGCTNSTNKPINDNPSRHSRGSEFLILNKSAIYSSSKQLLKSKKTPRHFNKNVPIQNSPDLFSQFQSSPIKKETDYAKFLSNKSVDCAYIKPANMSIHSLTNTVGKNRFIIDDRMDCISQIAAPLSLKPCYDSPDLFDASDFSDNLDCSADVCKQLF